MLSLVIPFILLFWEPFYLQEKMHSLILCNVSEKVKPPMKSVHVCSTIVFD